jgi:hypothetical protein
VAAGLARNYGSEPARLDVHEGESHIRLRLQPNPTPDHVEATLPPSPAIRFDQGGMGLELILAAYVLDGHGVGVILDTPGVNLDFPRESRS